MFGAHSLIVWLPKSCDGEVRTGVFFGTQSAIRARGEDVREDLWSGSYYSFVQFLVAKARKTFALRGPSLEKILYFDRGDGVKPPAGMTQEKFTTVRKKIGDE